MSKKAKSNRSKSRRITPWDDTSNPTPVQRFIKMHHQKGYHAAVGYAYHSSKNADINSIIVQAESKMYKDKAEYYKQHDRRARRQLNFPHLSTELSTGFHRYQH